MGDRVPHEEQGRGLITLGILSDPVTEQFFIHGEALDPAKLYSVAVSDYVGAGDTGYSDLLTPPVGDSLRESGLTTLRRISELVCKQVKDNVGGYNNAQCHNDPIEAASYFDRLNQEPYDTTKGLTPGQHFRIWARFERDGPVYIKASLR
jgi:hypothetical protein